MFETSEYKIQTLGNYPEENIHNSEPGESLKSRILGELIADYQDVFETKSGDYGRAEKVYHRIDTGDAWPIRQPPPRFPLAQVVYEQPWSLLGFRLF